MNQAGSDIRQVLERETTASLHRKLGTYVVPQTCPNPRLGSWDFTLPLAPPTHPSNNTELVSQSLCIRSSKDKSKVKLEAKRHHSSGKCNLR